MANIGTFTKTEQGYVGEIVTLSFQAWDHCTTDQGLDPADRRATTARMLHALLT